MNKIILRGRLTRDPEVRFTANGAVARYSLAVDRRFKQEGGPSADFFNCVCFGKSAEFVEKYFTKGMSVAIAGRVQVGNYTNKDGYKVNTWDVVVEEQEFAESKNQAAGEPLKECDTGFVSIPDGVDEELPFS